MGAILGHPFEVLIAVLAPQNLFALAQTLKA